MVASTGKRNSLNMEMDGKSLGKSRESLAIIAGNDTTPVSRTEQYRVFIRLYLHEQKQVTNGKRACHREGL